MVLHLHYDIVLLSVRKLISVLVLLQSDVYKAEMKKIAFNPTTSIVISTTTTSTSNLHRHERAKKKKKHARKLRCIKSGEVKNANET